MQRQIITAYRLNKRIIKQNRATYPRNAVLNAVGHMQDNDYGASSAEVFDEVSGKLFAQTVRPFGSRKIQITYQSQGVAGIAFGPAK